MLLKKGLRSAAAFLLAAIMVFTFPVSAMAVTTSYSKYTGKPYTHNAKFGDYDLHNGIDVSSHNGNIDWQKVKADGIEFAVMRAGFTGYTKSKHSINADPNVAKNIEGAKAAGIPVGVYWFSQALNENEARAEAKKTLEILGDYDLELPVFYDYEFYGVADGRLDSAWANKTITKAQMTANARAFCEVIEKAGYDAGIYANMSFFTNQLDNAGLSKNYSMWLAHFTTATNYTGDYYMWQYTESGKVNGISGNVDCDYMYLPEGTDIGIDPSKINKDVDVSLNYTNYEYTGSPIGPGLKVYDGKGKLLTYKEDYTIQYNGERIEPGTYSVTVNFIGDYEGIEPVTKEYTISARNANVVLNYTNYEYTGKPLGPGLKVYDSKGNLLTYKEDYTIQYNGERIQPGTYSVTVNFINDYKDIEPITKEFTITAKEATVVLNYTSYEYTGAPIGPGLKAYDENGNLLTYKEDYTVLYNGQRIEPGTYSVTVTFIGDYIHYLPVTKEYEITGNELKVNLNYTSYEFTGKPIGPGFKVTDSKGKILKANEDYTYKYNGNRTEPGTYSVTVTFIGKYVNYEPITEEYKITENNVNVKLNYTSYEYTGKPIGPGFTVTDSKGNVLKANVDYTYKYSEGRVEPGTYNVTIELRNAYRGTVVKEYTITENKVNVKLNYTTYEYTGKPMGPGFTVTDSKGNVLKANEDYTYTYDGERIEPGTYSVTITLIGSYKGKVVKEFNIVRS